MSVNEYNFVTIWKIEAPLKEVWDIICDIESFPHWWKAVVKVKILDRGDSDEVGSVTEQTWKGVFPYQLSFISRITAVNNLKSIELVATGDVEGRGKWTFSEEEGIVTVQYNWDVKTTGKGMNFLASILKPLLVWNHDEMMGWGAKGLANKLNARVTQLD